MALPIYGQFMQQVYANKHLKYKKGQFHIPTEVTETMIAEEFACEESEEDENIDSQLE